MGRVKNPVDPKNAEQRYATDLTQPETRRAASPRSEARRPTAHN